MPYFVWFGILGLLLLYAAGIVMLLVKGRKMHQLRKYHPTLGRVGVICLVIHAVWANLTHLGHSLPLMGWVGLAGVVGILFGAYSISRAKGGEGEWRSIHWRVALASLVLATAHALWFLIRILGR